MLNEYLNKAIKLAEMMECDKEFTMKSLFTDEEIVEIGSEIKRLGILFSQAVKENKVKGVKCERKTQQNENTYKKY